MTAEAPRLALVIFATDDVDRLARFYRDAFAWRAAVETPVYVEFEIPGGMRFGVYARRGFGANFGEVVAAPSASGVRGVELYLYADDPAAVIARATAAGGRSLSALAPRDWGDEVGYLVDPEGHVVAIARSRV